MKITLILPTLNEQEGMRKIMPRIKGDWVDQVLVLDGGSKDQTVEVAKSFGAEVYIQKSAGIRNGYYELLPHIKGDICITFSPNGTCIPELIFDLVAKMKEGHDMCIVSRYRGMACSENDNIITALGNWFFTKSVKFFYGGHITDVMGSFRAFKTKLIYDLDLDKDLSFYWPEKLFFTRLRWEPLLSVRALKSKLKIAEISGDEPLQIEGVKKDQFLRRGAAYYFQFLSEIFFWKTRKLSPELDEDFIENLSD